MSDCKHGGLHESAQEHVSLDQSACLSPDQGQILGLTDMSECDYTHLQHIIQTHIDTQRQNPDIHTNQNTNMDKNTIISPLSTVQAIDLSTASDGHDGHVLPVEKTPTYGEVPGYVLAKIKGGDTTAAPPGTCSVTSLTKGSSAARVCLEKRFSAVTGALGQQDLQSSVLSDFLTVVQQPPETQDAGAHPIRQRWIRCDTRTGSLIGLFNPVNNICGAVMHQSLIIPKGLPLNLCPERVQARNHIVKPNSPLLNDKKTSPAPKSVQCAKSTATKDTSDSPGDTGSGGRKRESGVVPRSLRKERHNSKERERRRRIRVCCDELNTLVPFCHTHTDKVTTLQWTTAYVRYISKIYGEALREDFQKTFTDKDGLMLDPSSVNALILQETQNICMTVEP